MAHPDIAQKIPEEIKKFKAPDIKFLPKQEKQRPKGDKNYENLWQKIKDGKDFGDFEGCLNEASVLGYVRKMDEKEIEAVRLEKERLDKRIQTARNGYEREDHVKSKDNLTKQALHYKGEAFCRNEFIDPEKRRKEGLPSLSPRERCEDELERYLFSHLRNLSEKARKYNVTEEDKKLKEEKGREEEKIERILREQEIGGKKTLNEILFISGKPEKGKVYETGFSAFETKTKGWGGNQGNPGKFYDGIVVIGGNIKNNEVFLKLQDFAGNLKEIKTFSKLKEEGKFLPIRELPLILKGIVFKKLVEEREKEYSLVQKELPDKTTVNSLRELKGKGEGLCAFEVFYKKSWAGKDFGKEKETKGVVVIQGQKEAKGMPRYAVKVFGPLKEYFEGGSTVFENLDASFSEAPKFLQDILKDRVLHRYIAPKAKKQEVQKLKPEKTEEAKKSETFSAEKKEEENFEDKVKKLLEKAKMLKIQKEDADLHYQKFVRQPDLEASLKKGQEFKKTKEEIITLLVKEKNLDPALLDVYFEKDKEGKEKASVVALDEKSGEYKELFSLEE